MSNEPISPPLDHVMIAGLGAWARSTSYAEALRLWRRFGGRGEPELVARVDAGAYVDQMGRLYASAIERVDTPAGRAALRRSASGPGGPPRGLGRVVPPRPIG